MRRGPYGSWLKHGCGITAGLGVVVLIALGVVVGVAVRQNRTPDFETRSFVPDVSRSAGGGAESIRLELRVHTAGVSVKPLAAGESIRIDADYDSRRHELKIGTDQDGETVVMTVELRPRGSTLMALLRMKLGGRPAMLRIGLPRDVSLDVEGHLERSYAVMELGGLSLGSASLQVEDGGVKLSFIEPVPVPMEMLSLSGSRSSLGIAGLGNASPRETRVFQHIGAVDLDLRGAWSRDASVRVIGGAAGGTLWLPENVRIGGLDDRPDFRLQTNPDSSLPTLTLEVNAHAGRFLVVE